MSKPLSVALAAAVALVVLAPVAPAAPEATTPPVRTIVDRQLGRVLATPTRQAIYVWNREPRGTIRCTGACAKAWPPVLVKKGVRVPMHVQGIKGDFGTIRRPGGARQLTLNRRPLYTYAHERPGQVLCNDVDDWFAVRVR
jgi:predicted lipoprotein with Yx(FWY)xxD motif